MRFSQDALIYCIVAKSYDEQTMLDKKSSTVRKNEMHLGNRLIINLIEINIFLFLIIKNTNLTQSQYLQTFYLSYIDFNKAIFFQLPI